MYELELENLLKMSALANTVNSCEDYIRRLQRLKKNIGMAGNNMGLAAITQLNRLDKMISKLDRRADSLDAENDFVKRDRIREEVARKDDVFKVSPLVDETQARKTYKTG